MFDSNGGSFVHTKSYDIGAGEGPIVEFKHEIILRNIDLLTRHDCCSEDRYHDVCLFVDEKQVACTPENYKIGYGRYIDFAVKYFNINMQIFCNLRLWYKPGLGKPANVTGLT
jgi:hypothetical protein